VVGRVQQTLPEGHENHLGNNAHVQIGFCTLTGPNLGLGLVEFTKTQQIDPRGTHGGVGAPAAGFEFDAHLVRQGVEHLSLFRMTGMARTRVKGHGLVQMKETLELARPFGIGTATTAFETRVARLFELPHHVHDHVEVVGTFFRHPGAILHRPTLKVVGIRVKIVLAAFKGSLQNVVRVGWRSVKVLKLLEFGKATRIDRAIGQGKFGFFLATYCLQRDRGGIVGVDTVKVGQGLGAIFGKERPFADETTLRDGRIETADKAVVILRVQNLHGARAPVIILQGYTSDILAARTRAGNRRALGNGKWQILQELDRGDHGGMPALRVDPVGLVERIFVLRRGQNVANRCQIEPEVGNVVDGMRGNVAQHLGGDGGKQARRDEGDRGENMGRRHGDKGKSDSLSFYRVSIRRL
jgi:hypothetical protein